MYDERIIMVHRIEVMKKIPDSAATIKKRQLQELGFRVEDISLVKAYTIDATLSEPQLADIAEMLCDSVFETFAIDKPVFQGEFTQAVEIGSQPGVTDNPGRTVRDEIMEIFGTRFDDQGVYSAKIFYLSGDISREQAVVFGNSEANTLIEKITVVSQDDFKKRGGMEIRVPKVKLPPVKKADLVDLLNADDAEMQRIGKLGVYDHNQEISESDYANSQQQAVGKNEDWRLGDLFEESGKFFKKVRRGPLAMSLEYIRAVKDYFVEECRNPFDAEVEVLAQTWSEHCKHTIFADAMDDIEEGIMKRYIKGATDKIRKLKGNKDICVSVFEDNAGVIKFDDNWNFVYKVETHNSPSALDPYGGAITGIVGVNRDPFGTGKGARLVINQSGPFMTGSQFNNRVLSKGKVPGEQIMLSPRRIHGGVFDGVRDGGNQSGIPSFHQFSVFADRYNPKTDLESLTSVEQDSIMYQGYDGKPLVFVGSGGIMPREINGEPSHVKKAQPGDLIVMVGGRIGKDGIHGATFSSEEMDAGSPATAVQIGDAFTQKKMHDMVLIARDRGLYRSITDNGAGGLSCSVGEMSKESGGCYVELEKAPLKYQGLEPWEILVSEAQERMTLAVQGDKIDEFLALAKMCDVEATVIGEFNESGRFKVDYHGDTVVDIDLDFLHNGLPKTHLKTKEVKRTYKEPEFDCLENLTDTLLTMLSRENIASHEYISQAYDHEVKGGSVLKPLQGRGRVDGSAVAFRPVLDSEKAVVISEGVNPSYSDISAYDMAACAIDTAIRNVVAAGGRLEDVHLLDNFCWSSSKDPTRLWQLKEAARACHDYAIAYLAPLISGKDSMFNDFEGFDENGNPIKISVPPTLLMTAISYISRARKAVSLDFKCEGDLIYVLGETKEELGGSEYFAMKGEEARGERFIGNSVPKVNAKKNLKTYQALEKAIQEGLVVSSLGVDKGGLGVALSKCAMGGRMGMEVNLAKAIGNFDRDDYGLFSQSQGRVVVSINPEYKDRFEKLMGKTDYSQVGVVREGDGDVVMQGILGEEVVKTDVRTMLSKYKGTFKDF
ncbi:MAG: AIR synthase-related protein [archaeon]